MHRHTKWTFLKGTSQFYPFQALFQTMENIFCQAPVYTHMNKNPREDSTGCGCERVQTHRIDHFIICVSKKNVTFAYAKKSLNKEKADPGQILPPLTLSLRGRGASVAR